MEPQQKTKNNENMRSKKSFILIVELGKCFLVPFYFSNNAFVSVEFQEGSPTPRMRGIPDENDGQMK